VDVLPTATLPVLDFEENRSLHLQLLAISDNNDFYSLRQQGRSQKFGLGLI